MSTSSISTTNATTTANYITVTSGAGGNFGDYITFESYGTGQAVGGVSIEAHVKKGISPTLYFKYIKKKFGTLQHMRLNSRLVQEAWNWIHGS